MNKFTTDQLTTALIILLLIVFAELTIFNNGGAFLLIITALLFYYSFSKRNRMLFWIGCFFAFIAILSVFTLRLFVVGILIYMLYRQSKKQKDVITLSDEAFEKGAIHKNDFFGSTAAPLDAYKWQDVQIQRFLGDITIDTTQTILPAGTSVITIRQSIGKVIILVPYDIPFRLQYSTILGEAKLLQNPPKRLMNEHLTFEDGETDGAKRKLVIHVATWLGDVEVARQ
ncbi:membrane protein [Ureibacillus massiliensis 4400831 = CIP 108448 = CCUG 49529]|uniref:Membrane protein n=2 Tax=cellular organisms TaxID=131567 RepID=A0A0A3IXB1_9BACL|nr:cell wall-active antibiotics response protein LiaF [Ureibacillus massiliensis]KGR89321.1 membrane protein [Ureibacillus massiliensis 4400831 = CIP 108448 = CCUG 49529]